MTTLGSMSRRPEGKELQNNNATIDELHLDQAYNTSIHECRDECNRLQDTIYMNNSHDMYSFDDVLSIIRYGSDHEGAQDYVSMQIDDRIAQRMDVPAGVTWNDIFANEDYLYNMMKLYRESDVQDEITWKPIKAAIRIYIEQKLGVSGVQDYFTNGRSIAQPLQITKSHEGVFLPIIIRSDTAQGMNLLIDHNLNVGLGYEEVGDVAILDGEDIMYHNLYRQFIEDYRLQIAESDILEGMYDKKRDFLHIRTRQGWTVRIYDGSYTLSNSTMVFDQMSQGIENMHIQVYEDVYRYDSETNVFVNGESHMHVGRTDIFGERVGDTYPPYVVQIIEQIPEIERNDALMNTIAQRLRDNNVVVLRDTYRRGIGEYRLGANEIFVQLGEDARAGDLGFVVKHVNDNVIVEEYGRYRRESFAHDDENGIVQYVLDRVQ